MSCHYQEYKVQYTGHTAKTNQNIASGVRLYIVGRKNKVNISWKRTFMFKKLESELAISILIREFLEAARDN